MTEEDGTGNDSGDSKGGDTNGGATISMTQKEFEARMTARVDQAVRAAMRAIDDKLGGKPDEIVEELTGLREARKAGMDDAERAKAEAEEAIAKATARAAELDERARDIEIRTALLTSSEDQAPVSPGSLGDASALVANAMRGGDDLEAAVKGVRERQPAMFGEGQSASNGSQGDGAPAARRSPASRQTSTDDDPHELGKAMVAGLTGDSDYVRPLDRKK